jgi:hypothetical protein
MSWIEFHEELTTHYKTLDLCRIYGCDVDTALGKLARFWFWCTKFAQDGDLRKHNDDRIGAAVGLNGDDAKRFVEAMVQSRWIDRDPYFRVHDWWDHTKEYWKSRYKRSPETWKRTEALYCTGTVPVLHRDNPSTAPLNQTGQDRTKQDRTEPKTKTPPNPPKRGELALEIPADLAGNSPEIHDWLAYKRQKGQTYKPRGLEALWGALRLIAPEKRRAAVDYSMANNWSGLFEKRESDRRSNGQSSTHAGSGAPANGAIPSKFAGITETVEV